MINEPPEDPRITELLARLGNKTAEYPPELLAGRRASFDQKLSSLGVGLAVGGAAKAGILKGGWTTENILKALIVTLIVAETAGGIIMYRQRYLRNIVPLVPTATVTIPSPTYLTPVQSIIATETPTLTATPTLTTTITYSPTSPQNQGPTATATRPGLRKGQTPTPPGQRTPGP
jgi:hypothetical protein